MQVYNIVVNHNRTVVITENQAIEIPGLNYGVRIAISQSEADEIILQIA